MQFSSQRKSLLNARHTMSSGIIELCRYLGHLYVAVDDAANPQVALVVNEAVPCTVDIPVPLPVAGVPGEAWGL